MAGIGARLADLGFGNPRGLLGRFGGRLMARGNAVTERRIVELAELAPREAVLVVGPGPGVGVQAAALCSAEVVAVDPSEAMLSMCRRRCAALIEQGKVRLAQGDAANTGQPGASVDVVLSVNNVMLWPDRDAALDELARVLRPGGRLLVSVHNTRLPGGLPALATAVATAGFGDIRTWIWEPPGHGATTAAQLTARRHNN